MAIGNFTDVGPVLFGGVDGAHPVSHTTLDSAYKQHVLGTRVTHQGEDYVYIHNASATDASVGRALVMSSLSGYSLTPSSLSGYDQPFCVVKHATIVAGGFGWGLVRGITNVAVESTVATGVWLTLGDDGAFKTFIGSSNTDTIQGAAVAKVLSSGTGVSTTGLPKAYVKCIG